MLLFVFGLGLECLVYYMFNLMLRINIVAFTFLLSPGGKKSSCPLAPAEHHITWHGM